MDILPIISYGNPVLKKVAKSINLTYPNLDKLIEVMFKTMQNANGVGLAAPQIGKSIRLFVIDVFDILDEKVNDFIKTSFVFINPVIKKEFGEEFKLKEGCLSIPYIHEEVMRFSKIEITYFDQNFTKKTNIFDGVTARVIQHEYDHLEGVLFLDHLSAFKRKLLQGKLNSIKKGKVKTDYPMFVK